MSRPTSLRAGLALVTLAALASPVVARSASAQFTYDPPGTLVDGSGEGRVDTTVYAPSIVFPIQSPPAFANSQVWGVGGLYGASGSQCSDTNFSYPWHDNYCETRTWDMPLCPAGVGHQGQDVRASSCEPEVHAVVAVADGTITNVGDYSVYLTTDEGQRFDYLHMRPVLVAEGDVVSAGDVIGYVADEFGGESTTVHLHFNIRQSVTGVGSVYVPPYLSLVAAYQRLLTATSPRLAAQYVDQSFPLASETFELAAGEPREGYLELRNVGTETWVPGHTFLATTEPRDGASAIEGPDWVSASRAATIDHEVAPGETGRFVFTVRAPAEPGVYDQFFNPVHDDAWFADDGGPIDRWIELKVTATEAVDADGDGYPAYLEDCDDDDDAIHPGVRDVCGNGVDEDCSGEDLACASDGGAGDGDAGDGDAGDGDAGASTSSGCGCRVAAREAGPSTWAGALTLLGLLALRRRRRGGR